MAEFPTIPYAGPAAARHGRYNKRYMVIHCTANNAPPINEATYARRRTDGVGMHFCSDNKTVLQVLESWYSTGHVGSAVGNQYGISWEFVGFLTSSTTYYQSCIDRAAPSMRLVMAKYGIPHRWLTNAQLRDGVSKGLVTHLQCAQVLGGSNHTDPGPNFPRQYLIDALNGSVGMNGDDDKMDHWTDPTMRTLAQRMDALRGNVKTYKVNYQAEIFNENDQTNVTETNEIAVELEKVNGNFAEVDTRMTAMEGTLAEIKSMLTNPAQVTAAEVVAELLKPENRSQFVTIAQEGAEAAEDA